MILIFLTSCSGRNLFFLSLFSIQEFCLYYFKLQDSLFGVFKVWYMIFANTINGDRVLLIYVCFWNFFLSPYLSCHYLYLPGKHAFASYYWVIFSHIIWISLNLLNEKLHTWCFYLSPIGPTKANCIFSDCLNFTKLVPIRNEEEHQYMLNHKHESTLQMYCKEKQGQRFCLEHQSRFELEELMQRFGELGHQVPFNKYYYLSTIFCPQNLSQSRLSIFSR